MRKMGFSRFEEATRLTKNPWSVNHPVLVVCYGLVSKAGSEVWRKGGERGLLIITPLDFMTDVLHRVVRWNRWAIDLREMEIGARPDGSEKLVCPLIRCVTNNLNMCWNDRYTGVPHNWSIQTYTSIYIIYLIRYKHSDVYVYIYYIPYKVYLDADRPGSLGSAAVAV